MSLRDPGSGFVERFHASGVWQDRTLAELIAERAALGPAAIAVADQHESLTYAEFLSRCGSIARWLITQAGMQPGNVVAVQAPNRVVLPIMHVACNIAGLTFLPLTTAWREREASHLLRTSCAAAVVVVEAQHHGFDHLAMVQSIRSELPHLRVVGTSEPAGADFDLATFAAGGDATVRRRHGPDEPRFVMVTSGTTELPRMSEWTDNNLWFFMREYIRAMDMTSDDIVLGLAPAGTGSTGYVYPVLAPLLTGAASVLLEDWSVHSALEVLRTQNVTVAVAIPT